MLHYNNIDLYKTINTNNITSIMYILSNQIILLSYGKMLNKQKKSIISNIYIYTIYK
jgi:hypothetical protein